MQHIKNVMIAVGGVVCLAGFCLATAGGRWIVPPVIFLAGTMLIALGMKLLHNAEERKRKRRAERHSDDADKLKATQAVRAAYYDFKFKGLIK